MTQPVTALPPPRNEPVLQYAPGTSERRELIAALRDQEVNPRPLPIRIGDRDHHGGGDPLQVRAPHRHSLVLGSGRQATAADVQAAVDAALAMRVEWSRTPWATRAGIFLRAADLLAGPWRARMNAATILGQSKSFLQSEIDAACELIDFWRWNVHFGAHIGEEQPVSPPGAWNRSELRPLEGFVLAITPFNFTSIAGNLPTAPALMGNVVVWKPSPTQQLAASLTLELLEAAGLPPGVINMVTGDGAAVSEVALAHPQLAGVHFTGSTPTFRRLWQAVASHLDGYRTYPRLVGETGGKNFIVAHPSASVQALLVAVLRGGFEYQGQKCSAPSRAYIPAPLWQRVRDPLIDAVNALTVGDPSDPTVFMGAVIDERAYRRHEAVLEAARSDPHLRLMVGGTCDESEGWFVAPTLYETDDPGHALLQRELFGPIVVVHPYSEPDWLAVLRMVDATSPYALTGAVFADDRAAVDLALSELRDAAGNVYVNDKPTGAVVGQQPFGGARASGTNDKSGSSLNLLRWVSPRAIKETFVPSTDWRYAHLEPDVAESP